MPNVAKTSDARPQMHNAAKTSDARPPTRNDERNRGGGRPRISAGRIYAAARPMTRDVSRPDGWSKTPEGGMSCGDA
ncbi:MAG: hypothetical protein JSV91_10105 [Phycisphaerales bacterium]|nr:MAG: hypothetical protein JSV91_10105 [Phycisphaerales bacterium]